MSPSTLMTDEYTSRGPTITLVIAEYDSNITSTSKNISILALKQTTVRLHKIPKIIILN